MSVVTIPIAQQKGIVARAAARYGIPPAILWGVYGTETDYGRNVNTSSAGAVGPFQFMSGTAAGLGIDPYNFAQAADGAARYLAQYKDRGVAGMLSAYNAGPAGGLVPSYVQSVLQHARTFSGAGAQNVSLLSGLPGPDIIGPLFKPNAKDPLHPRLNIEPGSAADQLGRVAGPAIGGVGDALSAIGKFFSLLLDLRFWIRVGQAVGGITLIVLGLKELGKTSGVGGAVAGGASRAASETGHVATKAAEATPAGRAGKMRSMGKGPRKPTSDQVSRADAKIARNGR